MFRHCALFSYTLTCALLMLELYWNDFALTHLSYKSLELVWYEFAQPICICWYEVAQSITNIAPTSKGTHPYTVGFHNFNLRIFNLRVSNPNKLIVSVCLTRCRISVCQGLGQKKHDEISEIDRIQSTMADGNLRWNAGVAGCMNMFTSWIA